MRISVYIHYPNATEIGLGNTNESYILVKKDIDISHIFPPNIPVSVSVCDSDKVYELKSKSGTEFRVNQFGQLYRDFSIRPGDELKFICVEKGGQKKIFIAITKYNRVFLSVTKSGAEIINLERLVDFSKNQIVPYELDIPEGKLSIIFSQSNKKRADSPEETDFYSVKVNNVELHKGQYFLTLGDTNSLSVVEKCKYNEILIDEDAETNTSVSTDLPLQQIWYGAPGTGKSRTIKGETKGKAVVRTTFHPDSDYSTFVGAYKPVMDDVGVLVTPVVTAKGIEFGETSSVKEKRITYRFVKQAFLKAYLGAWKKYSESPESPAPQYLVIEEINRGNCAQIFGDIFQLLDRGDNGFSEYPIESDEDLRQEIMRAFAEEEEYKLAEGMNIDGVLEDYTSNYGMSLTEDLKEGRVMLLPSNLYIWATMNTSDQSLFPIDSAFKRRWDWKYVPINTRMEDWYIEVGGEKYSWSIFLEKVNYEIFEATNSEDKQLGFYFCKATAGVIGAERFVNKVLFYLYNDVFKDYGLDRDFLHDAAGEVMPFKDFFTMDGNVNSEKVKTILENLEVTALNEESPADEV